ncbi:MAG: hypothetical protein M2R45_04165 [Verrucomicrobia subdivision 3 bacterium]|nr:hypothetical protein [Limisphaerales bacterium]MCS1413030.1 hypothetical protein [Limisphaerales bacterium]
MALLPCSADGLRILLLAPRSVVSSAHAATTLETAYCYDEVGNLTSQKNGREKIAAFAYVSLGSTTDALTTGQQSYKAVLL